MSDGLIGRQLNNFRIERLLGRGGMAAVYYGTDMGLNRPVAIKVIDERWRDDETFTSRFMSEARTIATWRNENIIQVYYAANEGNLNYFVMEYIEGDTLEAQMRILHYDQKLMPYQEVLRIARAIASGLDYAHQKGVIHRDIKPANIMLAHDDRVVIMDFGLALDTAKGTIGETFGTPHYIAPEQARDSGSVVPQSDQYAFGVILYEMLTGAVPFDNPSAMSVALMHMTELPPRPRAINPELTPEVESVLLKVLNKSPNERFASCIEMIDTLEHAIESNPHSEGGRIISAMAKIPASKEASAGQPSISAPIPHHAPTVERSASASQAESGNRMPVIVGAVVILAIFIFGTIFALSGNSSSDDSMVTLTVEAVDADASAAAEVVLNNTDTPIPASATVVQQATRTASLLVDPTELSDTEIPATDTSVPSTHTAIPPTHTPVPPTQTEILAIVTNTEIPATDTSIPIIATNTKLPASPTATRTAIVETAVPTLAFPKGSPISLFYDKDGFYLWNQTGRSLLSTNFKFEAIDKDSTALDKKFEGERWTRFYSRIDDENCVTIIFTPEPEEDLHPSECGDFNAVVTTNQDSELVFWMGAPQFRVLWRDKEVAICEAKAKRCDFNVP